MIDEHGQSKFEFEERVEKNYVDVELDLSDEVIEWLEKTAKENKVTIDEVVNDILRRYLDEHNEKNEATNK
jgi:dsDNA-binding SOS-regulon protein